MFIPLIFAAAALINPVQSTNYDDMSDDDFANYLKVHDDAVKTYGASAAKGCISGGIGASPGGFQALCIGCSLGAAGSVAADFVVDDKKEFVPPSGGYYYPEKK